ncbi:hypothetical protein JX265_010331 [Neoarthrinium moseri]|uniref:Uncharacterized protein n=1 Tax=Neoarthrinium moseri TaxID=1658444 RepID=A0A9P9WE68_9PEZI|nr:hypothetical protein JX265_010331 [Neoarthrinium moseri]
MSDPTERHGTTPPLQGQAVAYQTAGINAPEESTHSGLNDVGIVLVPRPSDDPRDPLNWSFKRKATIGLTLWFSLFTGFSAPFNGQVQIVQQAALYHKTTVEITYFRGRAFNLLGIAMNIGASAGPTFSGFITANHPWWDEYWWTIGLATLCLVLIFLFVEETTWDRTPGAQNFCAKGTWFQRRVQTFFPGTKVVKPSTGKDIVEAFVIPLKVSISPVLLLCAGFDAITFGFWVALNSLTPVWLQTPVKFGGYGFSVLDNAAFTTVHWMTLLLSQLYGHLLADWLPLWLCARNGGYTGS